MTPRIMWRVLDSGYQVNPPRRDLLLRAIIQYEEGFMAEFTLRVDNMHCGSCVRRVTQTLASQAGVEVKEVRIGAARFAAAEPVAADAAIFALTKAGYPARLDE
jgi:copper chaperone CopZ